ncbi:hypothetical protein IFM89_026864 [Coptis chinensis]|uniref:Uncharacterized protein n=1 Tax=Coptis chinensis TaxID=261450 RepID=A0A835HEG9_9MAGN|nr:hypothetical protein IFM89_026864 [Coptis chinensis]
MEVKEESDETSQNDQQWQPLLKYRQIADAEQQTPLQKAISQAFQSTAHLANLLPTGSVLAFQLLSPIFSNQVALFDQNVVTCFYPAPSEEMKELLTSLPVGIGVICSMLFIVFPNKAMESAFHFLLCNQFFLLLH